MLGRIRNQNSCHSALLLSYLLTWHHSKSPIILASYHSLRINCAFDVYILNNKYVNTIKYYTFIEELSYDNIQYIQVSLQAVQSVIYKQRV